MAPTSPRARREFAQSLATGVAADLVGAMPVAAFIVDIEGGVLTVNAPASALLPALKAGAPLVMAVRAPEILDAHRRVLAAGQAENVLWGERAPVERLFEVHVAPLGAVGGEASATLITMHDLTEARRVERMRVDFIANASHELRTPLASLLGFIETLQGSARDDAKNRERFLGLMRDQGRRMARLIDDLLSLSRIEQKQHVRPEGIVDLALVVRHVVDTLGPLAKQMNVRVDAKIEDGVEVIGERDELVRVAENLVENAIKYGARAEPGPDGDSILVEVFAGAREGRLTVRDFGRGVAPEHLPRLTERFYRVDPGQSRAKNGTGLGLAIVKHILTRHRGRLSIASTIGKGSTFTAIVPRAES